MFYQWLLLYSDHSFFIVEGVIRTQKGYFLDLAPNSQDHYHKEDAEVSIENWHFKLLI